MHCRITLRPLSLCTQNRSWLRHSRPLLAVKELPLHIKAMCGSSEGHPARQNFRCSMNMASPVHEHGGRIRPGTLDWHFAKAWVMCTPHPKPAPMWLPLLLPAPSHPPPQHPLGRTDLSLHGCAACRPPLNLQKRFITQGGFVALDRHGHRSKRSCPSDDSFWSCSVALRSWSSPLSARVRPWPFNSSKCSNT